MEAAALALAAVFCVVTGANDGASVLALTTRFGAPRLLWHGLVVLAAAVIVVPLVTTAVAITFSQRLVEVGPGQGGPTALVAVGSSLVVVGWLTSRGWPTSLTLSLIGALAGSSVGFGTSVAWPLVGVVLVIAAAAPVLAAGVALLVLAGVARLRPARHLGRSVRRAHHVAFAVQAVAYASNDGQKMVAVAALAAPQMVSLAAPSLAVSAVIGLLFVLGTLLALRPVASSLASGVVLLRPVGVAASELAAGLTVAASSALAAPVSMTQAVTGALLGSDLQNAYRRVRWDVAGRLARAWLLTLPLSFLLAAALSLVVVAAIG